MRHITLFFLTLALNLNGFAQSPCDNALDAAFTFNLDGSEATFHDQSMINVAPVHYTWDFGDGHVSHLEDPIHTYTDTGLYHVCLTIWAVHLGDTCSSTFCHDVHVAHLNDPPCHNALDASFTFTANGDEVTFHDQSLINVAPVHYTWDFGDGHVSHLEDPIHTYTDTGLYHVCLTIWAVHLGDTCTSTFCHDAHVAHLNDPPCHNALDASFTFTANGDEVTFHDQSLINVAPVHYTWDFGDDHTSHSENPIHTYADTGVYHVCLTIWAVHLGDTCSSTFCHDVHVAHLNDPPCHNALDASFSFTAAGNTVTFHDQSVINMTPVHYNWDFGDGSTAGGEDPIHTYADSGLYHVCLTIWVVHVNDTCTSTFCNDVHVMHHGGPHHAIHALSMPFHDELVLVGTDLASTEQLEVRSASGQLITTVRVSGEGPVRLWLAGVAPGIYVVRLIKPEGDSFICVMKY